MSKTRETIHITISAKDDPTDQWSAIVTNSDNQKDFFIAKADFVLMTELIDYIYRTAIVRWVGFKIIVGECSVKDDDDAGFLKPMLQKRLDLYNTNKSS